MSVMKQNKTNSKLFTAPTEKLEFITIDSPTSQKYVEQRKANMHKLQKEIEGYSEAYFSLSKYYV